MSFCPHRFYEKIEHLWEAKNGMHVMNPSEGNAYFCLCLSLSRIRMLFTYKFLDQVEHWTSIVTWKYWQGYMTRVREDLNFGLMLGSCIMTVPLLMMHSLSGSFWPKESIAKLEHLPELPCFALCNLWQFKYHRVSGIVHCMDLQWPFWRSSQKKHSSRVLNSGETPTQ